jgi:hypothetical protein
MNLKDRREPIGRREHGLDDAADFIRARLAAGAPGR